MNRNRDVEWFDSEPAWTAPKLTPNHSYWIKRCYEVTPRNKPVEPGLRPTRHIFS